MMTFSKLGRYGRLGNQLFQIAFITFFAKKYEISYELPQWEYSEYFDYDFSFSDGVMQDSDMIIYEPSIFYNETYFAKYVHEMKVKNVEIEGYLQSYKYFTKEHVLNIFKSNQKFIPIDINHKQSVAISVRRGDFVENPHYNNIEASKFIELLKNFNNFKVYVFSDDFEYCKKEFIGDQFVFMEDLSGIEQLITMRTFNYFILSNSTFSYWGAMLSSSPKKVYFPFFMSPSLNLSHKYNVDFWPPEDGIYESYINPIKRR